MGFSLMHVAGGTRTWTIIGVLVAVIAWIASGILFSGDRPARTAASPDEQRTAVAVRVSEAQPVERLLVLQGDLQPDLVVSVRAETGGQVETWHVRRGAAVQQGDLLAQLELGERESQLRQAQARVNVARKQLQATRQLVEEGFRPEIQLDTDRAELEAAEAELAAIEEDIARTRIRAPVPGRVDQRIAEQGDFVPAGGEVAQIVNNHPLRATVRVPQHSIEQVRVGQDARVHVLRHGVAEGRVTFVSSFADPATRTFVVEVEVPNPERVLPAGTSAEVEIPTEVVPAHQVSPAFIGLNDQGQVGVKTVSDEGRVEFHQIDVVRAEREGLWVAGLPERARIITVGQGFVRAGEEVVAQDEQAFDPDMEVGQTGGADG